MLLVGDSALAEVLDRAPIAAVSHEDHVFAFVEGWSVENALLLRAADPERHTRGSPWLMCSKHTFPSSSSSSPSAPRFVHIEVSPILLRANELIFFVSSNAACSRVFDLHSQQWIGAAALPSSRTQVGVTAGADGQTLVACDGHVDTSVLIVSTVERYDAH